MRRVVLHPSAFVDWLAPIDASELRAEFEAGRLEVMAPRSFVVDALGLLASRGWSADRLAKAGGEIERIGFRLGDPPLSEIAMWLARGFPASAATYAALASWSDASIALADPDLRKLFSVFPQVGT